jgi:hypothetical protein
MSFVRLRRIVLALSVVGIVVFFAWPSRSSRAGYTEGPQCSCTSYGSSGGSCAGSLQCFRDSAGVYDNAMLNGMYVSGQARFNFSATYANQYFTCNIYDSASAQMAIASVAGVSPKTRLWIYWDAAGVCQQVYTYNGSRYL